MLSFQLEAEDYMALLTGVGSNDIRIPRRVLNRADFPELADALIGQPVYYPYGDFSSLTPVSASGAPQFTYITAEGGYNEVGRIFSGFGPISDPTRSDPCPFYWNYSVEGGRGEFPAAVPHAAVDGTQKLVVTWDAAATAHDPPTNVACSAQAGGTLSADCPNSEYGVIVWTGTVGGVKTYFCALGWWYYGFRFQQILATTNLTCEFTRAPSWNAGGGMVLNADTMTPGAEQVTDVVRFEYGVSAILPDGETPISDYTIWLTSPLLRPALLRWTSVPNATGYRIYKRVMFGTWYKRFDVDNVTNWTDDLTDAAGVDITAPPPPHGQVEARYVGMRPDKTGFKWYTFVLAGCAIKGVTDAYQNGRRVDPGCWGATWVAPGMPGYATYFDSPFEDINGHRYTFLYVRGPDGLAGAGGEGVTAAPITVMLQGIETKGDSTGTLITNIFDQYKHFVRNIVCPPGYNTGDWKTSGPTWQDEPNDVEVIDDASFDACTTIAETLVSGGFTGRFLVGREGTAPGQSTIRTWLARLNQSADCYCGFSRKSQFVARMIDTRPATLAAAKRFSASSGILKDTFRITDAPQEMENPVNVKGALDWVLGTWEYSSSFEDIDAQPVAPDGTKEKKPYDLLLYCTTNTAQMAIIGSRRLARRKRPYRVVVFTSDLAALDVDLGDVILVSHFAGFGANGWTLEPCFVLKHDTNVDHLSVQLTALDLGYAMAQSMDVGWLPPVGGSGGGGGVDAEDMMALSDDLDGMVLAIMADVEFTQPV